MASWSEFNALTTPVAATSPSAIVTTDSPAFYTKINSVTGHFVDDAGNSALVTPDTGLDVSAQKQLIWPMRYGILNNDPDYVDRSLLAIEATLGFRNPVTIDGVFYDGAPGSFPAQKKGDTGKQHRIHNKLIVCDKIGHALRMFRESSFNVPGPRQDKVNMLVAQLAEVATWLIDSDDWTNFWREAERTNQLISGATTMEHAGVLSGVQRWIDEAQLKFANIFATRMTPDGVLPEKFGFDGSYQGYSQEMIGDYFLYQPAGAWRDQVGAALQLCVNRWLQSLIQTTGVWVDDGWTRTEEVDRVPGAFPISWNRDNMAWRLKWFQYLLPGAFDPPLDVVGDRTINVGQSFGHHPVVAPNAPVDLATLKDDLNIDDDKNDDWLARRVNGLWTYMERYCGRRLASPPAMFVDDWGTITPSPNTVEPPSLAYVRGASVFLRQYPVTAIEAITINGTGQPAGRVKVDPRTGKLVSLDGGDPLDLFSSLRQQQAQITYKAGWDTVPNDLYEIVLACIQPLWATRNAQQSAALPFPGATSINLVDVGVIEMDANPNAFQRASMGRGGTVDPILGPYTATLDWYVDHRNLSGSPLMASTTELADDDDDDDVDP